MKPQFLAQMQELIHSNEYSIKYILVDLGYLERIPFDRTACNIIYQAMQNFENKCFRYLADIASFTDQRVDKKNLNLWKGISGTDQVKDTSGIYENSPKMLLNPQLRYGLDFYISSTNHLRLLRCCKSENSIKTPNLDIIFPNPPPFYKDLSSRNKDLDDYTFRLSGDWKDHFIFFELSEEMEIPYKQVLFHLLPKLTETAHCAHLDVDGIKDEFYWEEGKAMIIFIDSEPDLS